MTPFDINRDLPEGATPLDPDEAQELLPRHIRTRGELNVWEQENILNAAAWIQLARKPALDEATIRELHRRMFSETWKWAGRYRTSDKTIGVHWPHISVAVWGFVEDGRLWSDMLLLQAGRSPVNWGGADLEITTPPAPPPSPRPRGA